MGVTREKNMQKFIALCALCAFASALPSDFHNDVILGRRAAKAVTTPCGCFSTDCKVTAPTNGAMGDCKTTMNSGSTCTPTCNNGFTKVGTTSSCTNTALTKPTCQGKPCTGLTDAKVLPAGATKTVACATLVTATVMNSGTTCGFTCPANQVVEKQPIVKRLCSHWDRAKHPIVPASTHMPKAQISQDLVQETAEKLWPWGEPVLLHPRPGTLALAKSHVPVHPPRTRSPSSRRTSHALQTLVLASLLHLQAVPQTAAPLH